MGGLRSKQFLELGGKPIVAWTIGRFQRADEVDEIVLAARAESIGELRSIAEGERFSKVAGIVEGGNKRQDSVWNAMKALRESPPDIVLIHDAVRPFVDGRLIRQSIEGAMEEGAAVVAVRPKDTIKISNFSGFVDQTPDREKLWSAQTPQAFRFSLIVEAFEKAVKDQFYGTDDASLLERAGVRVKIIEGNYENIKITTPEEMIFAEILLKERLPGVTRY